jgi:hypothetical protein
VVFVKLDASGAPQWQRAYGGPGHDRVNQLRAVGGDGYVAVGALGGVTGDNDDVWVMRLDISGAMMWQRSFGGLMDDVAHGVDLTPDGGFIVAAETLSVGLVPGWASGWLVKLGGGGHVHWRRSYGGPFGDSLTSVAHTPDGGFITCGVTASYGTAPGSKLDAWVLRLDADGEILWQRSYGGEAADETCTTVLVRPDGGFFMVGATKSFGSLFSWDDWVVALDETGEILWQRYYGREGKHDVSRDAHLAADGGVILGGATNTGLANSQFWLVKTHSDGSLDGDCTLSGLTDATVLDSQSEAVPTTAPHGPAPAVEVDLQLVPSKGQSEADHQCP